VAKRNNKHRRALEKIASNPEKFGFPKPISVSIEQNLFHKKRVLAQPDIVIEFLVRRTIHGLYVVEYKGYGNGELIERAQNQLSNAKWWYGKYRPDLEPENIHTKIISGDDPRYKDLLR